MRIAINADTMNTTWSDVPIMSGITIEWGTDDPGTQPDPAVCSFTIVDRDGTIAGDFSSLTGKRLTVSIDDALLFEGIIGAGGTIRRHGSSWLIDLTASSRMVLWKRLDDNGPSDMDGYHWTGQPWERVAELNRRAMQAGAPTADTSGLQLPASVSPYDMQSHPTQLELLHRLYAHLPDLPLWCEDLSDGKVTIGHTDIGRQHGIRLDDRARPFIAFADDVRRYPISAALIMTDDDMALSIEQPLTGITVNGKKAGLDDQGNTSFDDSTLSYSSPGLPDALKETIKTMSVDSDAILSSTLTGWPATVVTQAQRDQAAEWIRNNDTTCAPSTVTFDSDKLDPDTYPWAYQAQPSKPFLVEGGVLDSLTQADGTPTASVPWQTIGGTITIETRRRTPHITHTATIITVPHPNPGRITWHDIRNWPPSYAMTKITWSQLGIIEGVTR